MKPVSGVLPTPAAAGRRPEAHAQIVREYTYLYGAVSPAEGKADLLILPAMDSACMNVFLDELSRRYTGEYFDTGPERGFNPISVATHETLDADHGRIETRRYWTTKAPQGIVDQSQWPDLKSIGMVESARSGGG